MMNKPLTPLLTTVALCTAFIGCGEVEAPLDLNNLTNAFGNPTQTIKTYQWKDYEVKFISGLMENMESLYISGEVDLSESGQQELLDMFSGTHSWEKHYLPPEDGKAMWVRSDHSLAAYYKYPTATDPDDNHEFGLATYDQSNFSPNLSGLLSNQFGPPKKDIFEFIMGDRIIRSTFMENQFIHLISTSTQRFTKEEIDAMLTITSKKNSWVLSDEQNRFGGKLWNHKGLGYTAGYSEMPPKNPEIFTFSIQNDNNFPNKATESTP